MKKYIVILMGFVFAIIVTGCYRIEYNIELDNNGKGRITGLFAESKEYFSEDDLDAGEHEIKEYVFDDKEYIGYDISKEFDNYDDLVDALENTSENGSSLFDEVSIEKQPGLFTTKYIFDASTSTLIDENDEEYGSYSKTIASMIKIRITLSMPGEVDEDSLENCNLDEDGIIVFDYNPSDVNSFHAESSSVNVAPIIILAVLVLGAVVAVVVFFVFKANKTEPNNETIPETPSEENNKN